MYIYNDICNLCVTMFGSPENIKDYEEKLLEKCFDTQYEQQINLINTQYEPPPHI